MSILTPTESRRLRESMGGDFDPMMFAEAEEAMSNAIAETERQRLDLRAASPIRARCAQADMADTPLFGQADLL